MNRTSATITLAMCALGLLVGYAAHKPAVKIDAPISKPQKQNSRESTSSSNTAPIQLPKIHSDETLETLIAQGENATYAGLALWMLDASANDIAAYWEFRKTGEFGGDMKRLLFLNWTRLDPQAAIAAVAGTDNASIPWWSWAAHDPRAALTAAGPDQMKDVARGIGEFHPEWLRENFDLIPEAFQKEALDGLMTWKEDGDHVATLDFLKKQGIDSPRNLLHTLALKDPWAAFDWLQKNGHTHIIDNRPFSDPIDVLLDAMKSAHPDDLDRLAAMTPSGALKRKIETTILENLLATDPKAALERTKATDAPLVTAGRLAKIGTVLLHSDPERAFEIGADIMVACPKRFAPQRRIETGNDKSVWSSSDDTVVNFMETLFLKDAERTLNITAMGWETSPMIFRDLADKWAERDLSAYTDWADGQLEPRVRNAAVTQLVKRLSSQGHFNEAAEWALTVESPDSNNLYHLVNDWTRSNREEASAWLESLDVQESVKVELRNILKKRE